MTDKFITTQSAVDREIAAARRKLKGPVWESPRLEIEKKLDRVRLAFDRRLAGISYMGNDPAKLARIDDELAELRAVTSKMIQDVILTID